MTREFVTQNTKTNQAFVILFTNYACAKNIKLEWTYVNFITSGALQSVRNGHSDDSGCQNQCHSQISHRSLQKPGLLQKC